MPPPRILSADDQAVNESFIDPNIQPEAHWRDLIQRVHLGKKPLGQVVCRAPDDAMMREIQERLVQARLDWQVVALESLYCIYFYIPGAYLCDYWDKAGLLDAYGSTMDDDWVNTITPMLDEAFAMPISALVGLAVVERFPCTGGDSNPNTYYMAMPCVRGLCYGYSLSSTIKVIKDMDDSDDSDDSDSYSDDSDDGASS